MTDDDDTPFLPDIDDAPEVEPDDPRSHSDEDESEAEA